MKLSQRQLALQAGVSHALVGQWENHTKKPGRETLKKLADALMISPDELLNGHPTTPGRGVAINDPDERILLATFRGLSARQRKYLLELIGDLRRRGNTKS